MSSSHNLLFHWMQLCSRKEISKRRGIAWFETIRISRRTGKSFKEDSYWRYHKTETKWNVDHVGLEIKKSGFAGLTPAGLVLCGGGAETIGIVDAARRSLSMQVRLGAPVNITGLIDEILFHLMHQPLVWCNMVHVWNFNKREIFYRKISKYVDNIPVQGAVKKVVDLVKSFLP